MAAETQNSKTKIKKNMTFHCVYTQIISLMIFFLLCYHYDNFLKSEGSVSTRKSIFGSSFYAPKKSNPVPIVPADPTNVWQYQLIFFDLPINCLKLRKGEILLDSLASVEDAKVSPFV